MQLGIILLSALMLISPGDPGRNQLTITHLANMGVMISDGQYKVIIDAVFDPSLKDYEVLSTEDQNKLLNGEKPYDNIDAALATHIHSDHFDATAVNILLSNSRKTIFMGNREVMEALYSTESISDQSKNALPSHLLNKGKLKIKLINMPHVSERFKNVTHSAVLIQLDDKMILHTGDGELNAAHLSMNHFSAMEIDALITPYWNADKMKLIEKFIAPEKIYFTHIPPEDKLRISEEVAKIKASTECVTLDSYLEVFTVD